jgi:hypothetical protein
MRICANDDEIEYVPKGKMYYAEMAMYCVFITHDSRY